MLPIHSGDVHHRHSHTFSGATATVSRLLTNAKSRHSRCHLAIQIIVVICVLLPLIYLLSSDQTAASFMPSSGSRRGWGSRKDMKDLIPAFPAAHLRNLVLVAGHAVRIRSNDVVSGPQGISPHHGLFLLGCNTLHALSQVYTGLDLSLASKESSWFLEPYQKVPGESWPTVVNP